MAREIALYHHEKWDGSGYPHGLVREEIPLVARIVAISDVFDALTSKRPYKEAWPLDRALEEIRAGRRRHFDPQVVDAFFDVEDKVRAIKRNYKDERGKKRQPEQSGVEFDFVTYRH